jgi:hypothetical protein
MKPINLMNSFESAKAQSLSSGATPNIAIEDRSEGGNMGTRKESNRDEDQSAGKEGEEEIPIGDMSWVTL